MIPSEHRRISRLAVELAAAEPAAAGDGALALLDAASSLRRSLPAESRNDPVGLIERLLVRRRNRLADRAERLAATTFPRLAEPDRSAVLARLVSGGRLRSAAGPLLSSEAADERRAGVELMAATGEWSLVPQATGLIDAASPDQSRRVIDALGACVASLDSTGPPSPAAFERALAAVLDAAEHHGLGPSGSVERNVLHVALAMLAPSVRAGQFGRGPANWLDDVSEAMQLALRSALRSMGGPAGARRALELLITPALRAAAAERVAGITSADEIEKLAAHAHLFRRPARRSALLARLEPDRRLALANATADAVSQSRSIAVSRGVPGWLDAIAAPEAQHVRAMEPSLAHTDPITRLNAATCVVSTFRQDLSLDANESVAISAVLRMAFPPKRSPAHGLIEPGLRGTLRRSPHAAVRQLVHRLPSRGELHPAAIVAERRALGSDRAATLGRLAERIETGDSDAIMLAARLGCADELIEPLATASQTGEPRVAAGAARALGTARSPRARDLLELLLEHEAPRVRANAIEAAAARARRSNTPPELLRLDDPHHRPASTSVRVQLIARRADATTPDRVRGLLASAEPVRRAAGLWLTERSAAELKPMAGARWAEIAARVAESARRGESAAERARATRCARRMLAVTAG